jgi:hypothetical protein
MALDEYTYFTMNPLPTSTPQMYKFSSLDHFMLSVVNFDLFFFLFI